MTHSLFRLKILELASRQYGTNAAELRRVLGGGSITPALTYMTNHKSLICIQRPPLRAQYFVKQANADAWAAMQRRPNAEMKHHPGPMPKKVKASVTNWRRAPLVGDPKPQVRATTFMPALYEFVGPPKPGELSRLPLGCYSTEPASCAARACGIA